MAGVVWEVDGSGQLTFACMRARDGTRVVDFGGNVVGHGPLYGLDVVRPL